MAQGSTIAHLLLGIRHKYQTLNGLFINGHPFASHIGILTRVLSMFLKVPYGYVSQ